jgi:hypothetical protein
MHIGHQANIVEYEDYVLIILYSLKQEQEATVYRDWASFTIASMIYRGEVPSRNINGE